MSTPDYRVGLISDTHGHLHPDVFSLFEGVDIILHAGDIVDTDIITELETIAPVEKVLGNCDLQWPGYKSLINISLPFGSAILTHGHTLPREMLNSEGLADHFASMNPRLIVYGHTHKQAHEEIDGTLVVNPGAAGKPRFQDIPSVATLDWHESSDSLKITVHRLGWKTPNY